jgi:hypothetical protein
MRVLHWNFLGIIYQMDNEIWGITILGWSDFSILVMAVRFSLWLFSWHWYAFCWEEIH